MAALAKSLGNGSDGLPCEKPRLGKTAQPHLDPIDLGEVWTLLIPLLHDTPLAPLRRGFSCKPGDLLPPVAFLEGTTGSPAALD